MIAIQSTSSVKTKITERREIPHRETKPIFDYTKILKLKKMRKNEAIDYTFCAIKQENYELLFIESENMSQILNRILSILKELIICDILSDILDNILLYMACYYIPKYNTNLSLLLPI